VKTHTKDGKPIVLKRPIQRLYPLEIRNTDIQGTRPVIENTIKKTPENENFVNPVVDSNRPVNAAEGNVGPSLRPKQSATKRAQDRIAAWIEDLHAQDN